jgi:GDP-L-fucose synthase
VKYVIHLAAKVGGLFSNMEHNLIYFEENNKINENIIRICHELQIPTALFCLSTCIFPDKTEMKMKRTIAENTINNNDINQLLSSSSSFVPISESMIHDGPPHFSNEGYAFSKRNLECLVRYYVKVYNYDWFCISPTNIFGPNDNFDLIHGHVMPALIHKAIKVKATSDDFIIGGSGKALRQFIFSHDLAVKKKKDLF